VSVVNVDILVAVGLQLQFSLSLLQPTFMAEGSDGSEGFSQCADTLASCLSLKLASKSTGNMLFLGTIEHEFVVISPFSAYKLFVKRGSLAVEPSRPSGSSGLSFLVVVMIGMTLYLIVVVLQLHQYYLPVLPILSLRPLVIIQYLISFFYKEYRTICGWKIEPVV
jgi:hypothetical protein